MAVRRSNDLTDVCHQKGKQQRRKNKCLPPSASLLIALSIIGLLATAGSSSAQMGDGYHYYGPEMGSGFWPTNDGWNTGYKYSGISKRNLNNGLPDPYNKDSWEWRETFYMTEGAYLQTSVGLWYRDYLYLREPLMWWGETYQQSGDVSAKGSISVKMFWQPGPAAGTPPEEGKVMYFLETKSAFAGFTRPSGSGSASVPKGNQRIKYSDWGTPIGIESIARKLSQRKVSGTPSFTFDSGELSGEAQSSNLWAGIGAGAGYYVQTDDRGVIITAGMEAGGNYRKSDGQRVSNLRQDDGSMTVDTVFGVTPASGASGHHRGWTVEDNLLAQTTGFDLSKNWLGNYLNAKVEWSLAGGIEPRNDVVNPAKWVGDYPAIRNNYTETKSLSVTVTDLRQGLEAEADNNYTIRIHMPTENATEVAGTRQRVADDLGAPSNRVAADQPVDLFYNARSMSVAPDGGTAQTLKGALGVANGFLAMAGPEATVAAIFLAPVIEAVGKKVEENGVPENPIKATFTPDMSKFNASISDHRRVLNGDPTVNAPYTWRFNQNVFDSIKADPTGMYNGGNGITVYGVAGRNKWQTVVKGDGYDYHGYTGEKRFTVVYPDNYFDIWIWTVPVRGTR